jgi:tetratricopeptide (TPR) repeat protein
LLAAVTLALFGVAGLLLVPHGRGLYHFRAAERANARWDFDEARSHLAVCLEVWPESAPTRLLAARTARRANRLDEAERHLVRLQAAHGSSDQTAREWALLSAERGELDRVEDYLKSTVAPDDPDAPLVLEALARGYLLTDRLGSLLECTQLWLQVRPGDTHALFFRGLAWERLGHAGEAIPAYREAVAADPDNAEAQLHLGELLLTGTQGAAEALEHFERAQARRPSDVAARLGRARCHKALGNTAVARDLLDALLAEHPDNARALAERGRLALDENDAACAEARLRRAVALAPDDREALHGLIRALWMEDKQQEAKELEPRFQKLSADLARFQQLVQAVAKEPRNLALRTEAGEICLRHGRRDEGLRWLAGVLQVDPTYAPARAALKAFAGAAAPESPSEGSR